MKLPHALARFAPRLAAAVAAVLSTRDIYMPLLSLLNPLPGLLGFMLLSIVWSYIGALVQLVLVIILLVGGYTLALLLIGVPLALAMAIGVKPSMYTFASILVILLAAIVERRLRVKTLSGMSAVSEPRGVLAFASLAGNIFLLAVSIYAAYQLSASLGASIGEYLASYLATPPSKEAGAMLILHRLIATILNLYIVRLILFAVIAWLLYKAFTSIAEPIIYAIVASPADAATLVDRMVAEERDRLARGEAWHQKLLYSTISAIFALVSIPLTYSLVDVIISLNPSIASNPLAAKILHLLYGAAPIVSLAIYMLSRRMIGSFIARLASMHFPTLSMKPAIVLAVLTLLVAVMLAGPQATIRMVETVVLCPFTNTCTPVEPEPLRYIGVKLSNAFTRMAMETASIARLINALIVQAFQG